GICCPGRSRTRRGRSSVRRCRAIDTCGLLVPMDTPEPLRRRCPRGGVCSRCRGTGGRAAPLKGQPAQVITDAGAGEGRILLLVTALLTRQLSCGSGRPLGAASGHACLVLGVHLCGIILATGRGGFDAQEGEIRESWQEIEL